MREKRKEEKEKLAEKKGEYSSKEGKAPGSFATTERIASIAIIIVLVGFIVIDFSFYHGEKSNLDEGVITASVVGEENKTDVVEEDTAKVEEEKEEVKEAVVEEEKKLSGKIGFVIEKVYTEVNEDEDDLGYINKITFTIDNGKDKVLTPIVEVFSRGKIYKLYGIYIYTTIINKKNTRL